jgi:hypothetical protein
MNPSGAEADVSATHLSIRKTGAGHFTLVKTDKARHRVTEKHCSGSLEEVIERLLDQHENARAQAKRARDYGPVLEIIRRLCRDYPGLNHEDIPADWTDPLALYGCLVQELARFQIDPTAERKRLAGLLFDKGPEWVWKNRLRLVAERISFPGPGDDTEAAEEPLLSCS